MTLNCNGNLIDISSPKVMGILNLTPDSFYDGGVHNTDQLIVRQVEKMIGEGASFIDIGAYSSRPGAEAISEEDELGRIVPVIEMLLKKYPDVLISVDTFRSKVAAQCLEAGASLINDISAGHLDDQMMETVAKYQVPYIMMHMKGTPQTMQQHTQYDDLIKEVNYYFSERLDKARSYQIKDVIIDPGFGFAKTLGQNYELLNHLELLKFHESPILIGLSRKSMVYKPLASSAKEALNGTTALHMVALMKGASILRVHDVKEAVECVQLINQLSE
ncbi:MAG: dihydropteroate synthase [Bacteroidia bacterium]|nr:dihydropteroate synthase [Bacteroidia bacterium]